MYVYVQRKEKSVAQRFVLLAVEQKITFKIVSRPSWNFDWKTLFAHLELFQKSLPD